MHSTVPTPVMNKLNDWLRGDIQATIQKYVNNNRIILYGREQGW